MALARPPDNGAEAEPTVELPPRAIGRVPIDTL